MENKKSRIIGVDVGGTKILLQAFDKKWNLIEEEKVFTETKRGQKVFVAQLIALIEKYFHPKIQSIGVALPGIVDHQKGILIKAPHLPLKDFNAKKILSTYFKRPVAVDNDIKAFLYAQSQRTAFKKYKYLIAVMAGTGVGGAMMIEGKLFYGKQGFAGEIGHMVINEDSPLKKLEENLGGLFIPKIAKKLGIKKVFNSYHLAESSVDAKKVKNYLVQHLGIGLSNLNLAFNPEAFVLDGSIYKRFLKDSKKTLKKMIQESALDGKSPLIFDADKKHTAAMGVAMMSLR